MTEEKKLPTIEEWFEANKSEEGYAGMTIGWNDCISSPLDGAVNDAMRDFISGKIFHDKGKGNKFIQLEVTLDLVLSKDTDGKIVYFIDDASVEYS
jgi:hypothetical protein